MSNSQRAHFLRLSPKQQSEVKSMSLGKDNRRRSNSQRPNENELNSSNQPLFHTFCVGQSNRQLLVGPQNADWFVFEEYVHDLFKNNGQLEPGKLKQIHQIVDSLMSSTMSIYVYDRFKGQLLPSAMITLRDNIDEDSLIDSLDKLWQIFYKCILPTLESMLYDIERNNILSIRKLALVAFRDNILLTFPLEDQIKQIHHKSHQLGKSLVHMILIVQTVFEIFPPSKNKLKMEKLAALVVSPYLGYRGLYINYSNETPVVKSNEHLFIAKMKNNSILSGKLCSMSHEHSSSADQSNIRQSNSQTNLNESVTTSLPKRKTINYYMAKIHRQF